MTITIETTLWRESAESTAGHDQLSFRWTLFTVRQLKQHSAHRLSQTAKFETPNDLPIQAAPSYYALFVQLQKRTWIQNQKHLHAVLQRSNSFRGRTFKSYLPEDRERCSKAIVVSSTEQRSAGASPSIVELSVSFSRILLRTKSGQNIFVQNWSTG